MKTINFLILVASLGYAGSAMAMGNLVWQERAVVKMGYGDREVVSTAQFYCHNLGSIGEWRLPTSEELIRLGQSEMGHDGSYWSSSQIKSSYLQALVVELATGKIRSESILAEHWVRCVRDS